MSERAFWYVNMVRQVCVEAPAGMTSRIIQEALYTEDEWVIAGDEEEPLGGPFKTERPRRVTLRIDSDGSVSKTRPTEPAPDDAWFEWRGSEWATDGHGMWERSVAPERPRGLWVTGLSEDSLGTIVSQFGADIGRRDGTVDNKSATCAVIKCDGYRVLLDAALIGALVVDQWFCGSPVAPVQCFSGGSLVAVLMPQRDLALVTP